MKVVLVLSLVLALSQATPSKNVCDICIAAITQIEEVITDPTNEQLVSFKLYSRIAWTVIFRSPMLCLMLANCCFLMNPIRVIASTKLTSTFRMSLTWSSTITLSPKIFVAFYPLVLECNKNCLHLTFSFPQSQDWTPLPWILWRERHCNAIC